MSFALFVLLNAILLIRPEELFPGAGLHLYLIVIASCLLTSGARILALLNPHELAKRPITVCVLGVLAAGVLSQVARGQVGLAMNFASDFGKVVLYHLLLVAVLDTPRRLHAFLGWLVLFVMVLSTLGILQYYEVINLPALRPLERIHLTRGADEADVVLQLCSSGIYNDPNDLCLILVTGSLCALYRACAVATFATRIVWLLPIGLFGYAMLLTRSRGGLLGLLAALLVWVHGKYGWRALVPLAGVILPVIALAGGRQTNINLSREDTAVGRILAWSDGLNAMMRNPITGIGVDEYEGEVGLVAHNSFVHAYVESGLIGGCFFSGAFVLSLVGLYRCRPKRGTTLATLRPFLLAIVIGYCGGIFSVSRNYVVPTYMIVGLAGVYLQLVWPSPPNWLRFSLLTAIRLVVIGTICLVVLRLITMILLSLSA